MDSSRVGLFPFTSTWVQLVPSLTLPFMLFTIPVTYWMTERPFRSVTSSPSQLKPNKEYSFLNWRLLSPTRFLFSLCRWRWRPSTPSGSDRWRQRSWRTCTSLSRRADWARTSACRPTGKLMPNCARQTSNTDTWAAVFGSTGCCPHSAMSAASGATSTVFATWLRTSTPFKKRLLISQEPLFCF